MVFKTYADLEKFVEQTLLVPEKDFKKYVIFNLILLPASIKSLSEVKLSPFMDLLKKEGKLISSDENE